MMTMTGAENRKPRVELPSDAGQVIRLEIADGADCTALQQPMSSADITGTEALDIIKSFGDDAPVTPSSAVAFAQNAVEEEGWERPREIAQKPLAAPFDYALLPDALGGYVHDIAWHMQCPPDYVAAALIVGLSAICAPIAVVKPKPGWRVTLNLWGAAVGRPGSMKSPAINAALAPLHTLQRIAWQEHERAVEQWNVEAALQEAAAKAARAEAEKLARSDPERARALFASIIKIPEPAPKRYIINDATQEALGAIMKNNPCTLLVDDELTAILRLCDKQGQESLRDFYLKSYDGDQSHTWDRITREITHVERCSLAIFGGIQPSKLALYVHDALRGGPGDDGLLQRFGLLVYPDITPDFVNVKTEMDEEARAAVENIFKRITALPIEAQRTLHLSFDATEIFDKWYEALEHELRAGELSPALESHFSKYRKLVPALAGIFALAENPRCAQIELQHVQFAISWSKYLRSHAERVYFEQSESATLEAARKLLEKLRNGFVDLASGAVSVRLLSRKHALGRNSDYEAIRRVCGVLCDFGYMRVSAYDNNNRVAGYAVHPELRYTYKMLEWDSLSGYKKIAQNLH
ncbi:MAG: DUF3987 domain-containing protein [Actinomycetaceae bacterium]|nr:DUF3987 domain-containing protein [Actinomycetaceae bacterium]